MSESPVTAELLLQAYTAGYFPMARSEKGRNLYWFNPEIRGALPLDEMGAFHIPRSLKKFMRHCDYRVTVDTAFGQVIRACADNRREGRDSTWINKEIIALYSELHTLGFAHSVEVWAGDSPESGVQSSGSEQELQSAQQRASALSERSDVHLSASRHEGDKPRTNKQTLVGGLYGVSIGGAFFGESMFSTRTNASKLALVHLVRRLQAAGYTLLDAQFENDHLTQFGFRAIAQEDYLRLLRHALNISPNPSSRFLTVSVSRF